VTGPIFHLALADDWRAAEDEGEYRVSTRGASLDDVGFLHASHAHQVAGVAARYYADVTEELVLLVIDPDRLGVPVVEEVPPGGDEAFPHIYGPLPVSAVVEVRAVGRSADGGFVLAVDGR
jgi:uncharacterized protein (DUF952 family)